MLWQTNKIKIKKISFIKINEKIKLNKIKYYK